MALIKSNLKSSIQVFSDQISTLFTGFPQSVTENAEKWANAVDAYAKLVVPISTTSVAARSAFLAIMNGLADPVAETSLIAPYTLYYKSPETKLLLFNRYLTTVLKYRPNPLLDKTAIFKKLSDIRSVYNQLYPTLSLSIEDIRYNQCRFNEIYATEIAEKKKFSLQEDGVSIDTQGLPSKYNHIPVNRDGIIIALQEDGIIGDDTIRYWPQILFSLRQETGNKAWNTKYATIPYITQPSTSGEVWVSVPKLNKNGDYIVNRERVSNAVFRRNFIDKGLAPDYTKIPIDKSQFQIDGGLTPNNITVQQFMTEFEANHSRCDIVWVANNIKTIKEYNIFLALKSKLYKAKPEVQKDGIVTLNNAIVVYAQQLAIGMAPTFTAAQGVVPIDLSPVKALGASGATNSQCIDLMVNIIDAYFKTGIAINNSSGVSTPWT